ncbi:DUF3383 domain-containing protein [Acinetobacter sp. NIPH 1869]|uniref:DUF3383 family protein n=1 Tax=Acinetobacter higginsii TaxID=70347 RepID=UPI001F4BC507|nr:DUF3383 family protein [Acinetobacter higginsii]MCH7305626.1 DUF3383 domain-containing protein [Acinetobacter higginsii]
MNALDQIKEVWDATQSFYGFCFADSLPLEDIQAVAEWAQEHYRMPFFVIENIDEAAVTGNTLKGLEQYHYNITYHQDFSVVGAVMGFALDQKYEKRDGVKSLYAKSMVGVETSNVGQVQANNLNQAGVNYYAAYGNPESPLGCYSSGYAGGKMYFDFVMGMDWLRDAIETNVFNGIRLRRTTAQNEDGMSLIDADIVRALERAVATKLVGPGQWNGAPVGEIGTGDWMQNGYYIYHDLVRDQSQQDRSDRIAPPITVLAKGAGSFHGIDILIVPEQ